MKRILTIGASSSKSSINRQLAKFAASQLKDVEIDLLDLNDFEMPIYSFDRENDTGIPDLAKQFGEKVVNCDAVVISFAEHNGSYSAAFKNVLDWGSRLDEKIWNAKHMFLLATSPGGRGAATVLNLATNYFPFMGAKVEASFSLPSYYDNFSVEEGIKNAGLKTEFETQLAKFQDVI